MKKGYRNYDTLLHYDQEKGEDVVYPFKNRPNRTTATSPSFLTLS